MPASCAACTAHGGSLPEGAVEQEALAGRVREARAAYRQGAHDRLARHRAHAARAWDDSGPFRRSGFSRAGSMSAISGRPARPMAALAVTAQPRCAIDSCAKPTFMLAGTATSIIFGFGRLRLFHQLDVFVDRLDLQARVELPSPSPMVETVSPL